MVGPKFYEVMITWNIYLEFLQYFSSKPLEDLKLNVRVIMCILSESWRTIPQW